MNKRTLDQMIRHLTPNTIRLLRMLRNHAQLEEWKPRQTIQANRMGLLKLVRGKLMLNAEGEKVANQL